MGTINAVWAMARIGSPHARRLLAAYIRTLQQDAERSAHLLDWIAAQPDMPAGRPSSFACAITSRGSSMS